MWQLTFPKGGGSEGHGYAVIMISKGVVLVFCVSAWDSPRSGQRDRNRKKSKTDRMEYDK
uniref:Uncharacterized protein n=1 Tax=Anguilla anguilla TaxID=7936 RepID=A0A0E9VGM6_ANGAN